MGNCACAIFVSRHEGLDVFLAKLPSRSSKELILLRDIFWVDCARNGCCSICLQSAGIFYFLCKVSGCFVPRGADRRDVVGDLLTMATSASFPPLL